jgi:hypothetical protein
VKAISFNFITERCNNEVLAIGLNSVREIIRRIPAILREDGMGDFIADLAQYSRKTHKSVMIAAHGVVNLVRDIYPTLLHKSHRGKFYNVNSFPAQYGEFAAKEGVEGAYLLDAYERGDIEVDSDGEVYYKEDRLKDVYGNDILEEEEEEGDSEDSDEAPELVDMREYEVIEDDEEEEEEEGRGGERSREKRKRHGQEEDEEEEQEEELAKKPSGKKTKLAAQAAVEEDDVDADGDDEEEEGWEEMEDESDIEDDGDDWEDVDEEEEEEEDEPKNKSSKAKGINKKKGVSFKAIEDAKAARKDRNNSSSSRVDSSRLLSVADFDLLEKLKAAQRERDQDPKFRFKRKHEKISHGDDANSDDDEEALARTPYSLEPGSLAPARKTHKSTKIERVSRILEGRSENRFEHEGHGGGLTNREKDRKKNFLMVRKGKASVSQKGRKKNCDERDKKLNSRKEQKGREKRKRRRT